jgi:hypothetical protein
MGRGDLVQASKRIEQSDFLCFGGTDPPVCVTEAGWYEGRMPDSLMMNGMEWNAVHACMQNKAFRCKEEIYHQNHFIFDPVESVQDLITA